ncbi:DoxX family protein [Lolliginicoccus levis]|uniref:DoxX family protein n=1 Tax=Lolliginicoccus levis TaxID=2919542 RepID=UPI00241DF96C|nr:DoxX family protein [Lolliginicoccus levis]
MSDKRDDADASSPNDSWGAAPSASDSGKDGSGTAPSPFDHATEEIAVGRPPRAESAAEQTSAMSLGDIDDEGDSRDDATSAPGFAWSRTPEAEPGAAANPYSQHVTRGRPARAAAASGREDDPATEQQAPPGPVESAPTEQIPINRDPEPEQAYSSSQTVILKRPGNMDDTTPGLAPRSAEYHDPQPVAYDEPAAQAMPYGGYQEQDRGGMVVAPTAVEPRRGTLDLGLLLLRLLIGGALITDGVRHLLGQGGGLGIDGVEELFATAGYDFAGIVAISVLSAQIGGGALIVLGLATPFGAAVALAAMINVWAANQGARSALDGIGTPALELATILGVAAAGLVLTGPGRMSLERNAKWAVRPRWGASVLLVLGIIGGIAAWLVLTGKV